VKKETSGTELAPVSPGSESTLGKSNLLDPGNQMRQQQPVKNRLQMLTPTNEQYSQMIVTPQFPILKSSGVSVNSVKQDNSVIISDNDPDPTVTRYADFNLPPKNTPKIFHFRDPKKFSNNYT